MRPAPTAASRSPLPQTRYPTQAPPLPLVPSASGGQQAYKRAPLYGTGLILTSHGARGDGQFHFFRMIARGTSPAWRRMTRGRYTRPARTVGVAVGVRVGVADG